MTRTIRTLGLTTLALTLAATGLLGTPAQAGQEPARQRVATGRDGEVRRAREVRQPRRQHVRRFVQSLQIDDAQRAQVLRSARALAPIGSDVRAEAQRIIAAARAAHPGDRAAVRAAIVPQLKALRERVAAQAAPEGRALIQSLTPEQRARIEAKLAQHGRTFDAEHASKRLGLWLAKPKVLEHLEKRGTHGEKSRTR